MMIAGEVRPGDSTAVRELLKPADKFDTHKSEAPFFSALPQAARSAISQYLPPGVVIGEINYWRRPLISPDNSLKFRVTDAHGKERLFVDWASAVAPDSVRAARERAHAFASAIGPELGEWVVVPSLIGPFEGRSCSVTPLLHEKSNLPLLRRVHQVWLERQAMHWLQGVAVATSRRATDEELERLFIQPYDLMLRHQRVSQDARRHVRLALHRVHSQRWRPHVQAAHYDLLPQNILVDGFGLFAKPRIVDWGGASVVGHGFFDMLNLGESSRLPKSFVAKMVRRTAHGLDQPVETALLHSLAAVGHLRMTQPMFSDDLFERLVQQSMDYTGSLQLSVGAQGTSKTERGQRRLSTPADSGWHASAFASAFE